MKYLQPRKKKFDVSDYGSVDKCLDAMKEEGYIPVKRTEKPIFKEGEKGIEVMKQMIIYEGKLVKTER